jgi:uncharacterized OsmC-like protein
MVFTACLGACSAMNLAIISSKVKSSIVKQMHVHSTAESSPGEGPVFTIYLPAVAEKPARMQ